MSINIQYLKQFSKEYKDFIIVLSKLSELKNIKNLPFDVNIFIRNKELEKILQDNHYYECFVKSNKYKYFHNIKLILLNNLKNEHFILEGAKLFLKFRELKILILLTKKLPLFFLYFEKEYDFNIIPKIRLEHKLL